MPVRVVGSDASSDEVLIQRLQHTYCPLSGVVVCPGETSGVGVADVPGVSFMLPPELVPEDDDPELLGPVLLVSLCIRELAGKDVVLSPVLLVPEVVPLPVMPPAQAPSSKAEQAKGIVHFIIDCSRKKNE